MLQYIYEAEEIIEDGDRLVVIGTKKRLAALESIFEGVSK